jgi:ATP-dependent Lon protease
MTDPAVESYPVLPLKNVVVYPDVVHHLAVGRPRSLAALVAAAEGSRELLGVAQKAPNIEDPDLDDLHSVGTVMKISRIENQDKNAQLIVQGIRRVAIGARVPESGYLRIEATPLETLSMTGAAPEADALLRENLRLAQQIARLMDSENGTQIYQQLIGSISDPITQMYRIANIANLTVDQQQTVLDANDPVALMQAIHDILTHEQQVAEVRRQIAEQAREDIDQQQREHVLRQQKRAIEHALGEGEDDPDIAELKAELDQAELPEAVQKEVDRELNRLKRMSANAADYQVARAYLELIAELPWHATTEDQLDLTHAESVLDEDHYGLGEVKDRILDSLAVMKLNPESKAPILCFVGPPGVGKTSLGQSIARAMGRKFERISLGGLHDEAELRGHRRTYIGAMPGRILQAIRRAGVINPILMLDEIDKLGRDFRGDPSAALMEILDPAQNQEFRDNYLNLPFDLSKAMFITTANTLEGIPRPLLDRMEVLELSGYSDLEKQAIARQYLIPRQRDEAGLPDEQLEITDDALKTIIRRYTREAGVRELERAIGRVARKRARQVVDAGVPAEAEAADAPAPDGTVNTDDLAEMLGPEKFKSEQSRPSLKPGVAAGLAWTEAGGDVLYVEATLTQKDEKVTLTGHLGQVMQESARAARSHLWSAAEELGLDREKIEGSGVHIHVPAGAVPKDGPSAGVTMAAALYSAYTGKPTPSDLAMTGELTLSGLVLPVGGIKEKLLAAHRAGMKKILLPKDNESDLTKLPDTVRADLDVVLVETLEEVLEAAFD